MLLGGCVETDYLLQAAEGQLDLACRARSIEASVKDSELDPRTRTLLADIPAIKAFARQKGLVPTSSYERFVALDRPSVVWVVTAAPRLSLEPKRWWFPIAGTVPYLGWFDKALARWSARLLAEEGWDVDVRGASAYSTLGWFDDPVLSSMIPDEPDALAELANTILHESVHATAYVPGQSTWNEGLATYVGDALTVEYLTTRYGADSTELAAWREGEAYAETVHDELAKARQELVSLYASSKSEAEKLTKKSEILRRARASTGFRRPITNATLATFSTYHGGEAALGKLHEACGGDLSRLLAVAKSASSSDFNAPSTENLEPVVQRLSKRCAEPTAAR